jgi:hypothetical protein
MSAMEADQQDGGMVLHYAPRHVRHPSEERSVRPILERLRRGESGEAANVPAEPAPLALEPPRRAGWELIACSAASALLSAGLGVLAIGWLAPVQTEPARIDSAQFAPKVVRTVAFQRPAPETSTAAAPTEVQPEARPAPAGEPDSRRDQIAPKELLAMWSGIPTETRAEPPVEVMTSTAVRDVQPPTELEAETPTASPAQHRAPARHRQAHAHRNAPRRASVPHRASANTAQAAAAQMTDSNPLQSALQSVFGGQPAAAQQPRVRQSGGTSAPPQPQVQNY